MTTTLTMAGYQGAWSVHTRALELLSSELAREVPGMFDVRVEADVTASGQTARALFDAVEVGRTTLCYMASGYLSARVPALTALDLPFTVHDPAAALAALDGVAGEIIAREIAARTGLRVLRYWNNGLRHLSHRTRPIRHPDDCAGTVIRTLDNALYRESLAAIGFRPVFLDVRDLRTAIADGSVDAQDNPLTNLLNFDEEVRLPFVSLTGHVFGVALLVCGRDWFDALPRDAARALLAASDAATTAQRAAALAEDSSALERLAGRGAIVTAADRLETPAFCARVAPLVARERAKFPRMLADAYLGPAG